MASTAGNSNSGGALRTKSGRLVTHARYVLDAGSGYTRVHSFGVGTETKLVHHLCKESLPRIVEAIAAWSKSKDTAWIRSLKEHFENSAYAIQLPIVLRATAGLRGALDCGDIHLKEVELFKDELERQL